MFCYDKATNKSYLANIKDIGQENLFYDIKGLLPGTIEKNFAKKEDLYKIGYSQLLKTMDINKLDGYPRKFLFLFITAQYFRTAEVRENIQNTSDQAINKLFEKSGIKIPHGLRIYTNPESAKRIHLSLLLDRDMIFSVTDMLAEQKWIILQNETGIPLWTSDSQLLFATSFAQCL